MSGQLMPPEPLESGIHKYTNAAALAYQEVARLGFQPAPKPNQAYQGYLPTNLTDLDDKQMGDLLNEISIWCSWAEGEVARVAIVKNATEKRLEFIKSRIRAMIRAGEEKLSNPDKDDQVNINPLVVQEELNLLVASAVYDMTRSMARGGQKDWETVSRHITQRGQELERMGRGHSVGQTPVGPGRTFVRR